MVDATGAGDLFAAGLLHGVVEGRDWLTAARMGCVAAAEVIGHYGARPEADLRAVLGRDVRTANDADCLAASEARDGAGAGANVVFAVDLGSGVGGGVAVAGRAHHGSGQNR